MARFIPKSKHKRHQIYIDAFLRYKHDYEFRGLINRFIFDPNISPSNLDDLEVLIHILFDSGYGKYHISYYQCQIEMIKQGRSKARKTRIIRRLARYSEFLSGYSPLFMTDFCDYILRYCPQIISELFSLMNPESRVVFVRMAERYPHVVRQVPKLKLYMVFS